MFTALAMRAYALAKRSGALDHPLARQAFRTAYFAYKRHVEDPFAKPTTRHPELFAQGHVLDVGANIGYTATVFAAAIGEGQRVFAFEPDPDNFAQLQETVRSAGLGARVEAVRSAVGETSGTIFLAQSSASHADHRVTTDPSGDRPTVEVPLVSLDDFCKERDLLDQIGFIKIDVQGHEPEVLRGMTELCEGSRRAAVVVEYCTLPDFAESSRAALETLRARRFSLFAIGLDGSLSRVATDGDLITHAGERGYVDVLARR